MLLNTDSNAAPEPDSSSPTGPAAAVEAAAPGNPNPRCSRASRPASKDTRLPGPDPCPLRDPVFSPLLPALSTLLLRIRNEVCGDATLAAAADAAASAAATGAAIFRLLQDTATGTASSRLVRAMPGGDACAIGGESSLRRSTASLGGRAPSTAAAGELPAAPDLQPLALQAAATGSGALSIELGDVNSLRSIALEPHGRLAPRQVASDTLAGCVISKQIPATTKTSTFQQARWVAR